MGRPAWVSQGAIHSNLEQDAVAPLAILHRVARPAPAVEACPAQSFGERHAPDPLPANPSMA